jgi:hypothetical protein
MTSSIKTLFRLHVQCGLTIAGLVSIMALSLGMRAVQVYFEKLQRTPSENLTIFEAIAQAVPRRTDDPSFWALFTGVLAALWLLRASSKAFAVDNTLELPRVFLGRGTVLWIVCSAISCGIYLVSVYFTKGTFWYMRDRTNPVGLGGWIPTIQKIEGTLNLLAICWTMTLVPPAKTLVRWLHARVRSTPESEGLSMDMRKCAAALASIGMMPFSLVVLLALNKVLLHLVFKAFPQIVDAKVDILKGMGSALIICWPMLWISWDVLRIKRIPMNISVMKTLVLPIYLVLLAFNEVKCPSWIFQPSTIANPIMRYPVEFAQKIATLGSVVVVWFDPKR